MWCCCCPTARQHSLGDFDEVSFVCLLHLCCLFNGRNKAIVYAGNVHSEVRSMYWWAADNSVGEKHMLISCLYNKERSHIGRLSKDLKIPETWKKGIWMNISLTQVSSCMHFLFCSRFSFWQMKNQEWKRKCIQWDKSGYTLPSKFQTLR